MPSGVFITSDSHSVPALNIGTGWLPSTIIKINNGGAIIGHGGSGSSIKGGDAIQITSGLTKVEILNSGYIWGGGGSGGQGGWGNCAAYADYGGAGGGGAGSGLSTCAGGGSGCSGPGSDIFNLGINSGGAGGSPGACAGWGGTGGTYGNVGTAGQNATWPAGAGGEGGYSIVKSGVNVLYNGTNLAINMNYSGWKSGTRGRVAP